MKNFRALAMLAITSTLLVSAVLAQTPEVAKTSVNYSPYFAKVGRTIFVSGPAGHWLGQLTRSLPPNVNAETAMRAYNSDVSRAVDLVVFVNATSPNPESVRGSWFLIKRLKEHAISTKIVGECDMFCGRLFIAGKTREFGQDLNGEPARLKIQVPVDLETKLIERRFPNTQIALYENLLPEFTNKHRELLVRGFTQPTDTTGGVFIGPNDVKYCATLKSDCENYTGLEAFKMGLTTSPERTSVVLPDRFPAPVPTRYAAIDDLSKVPLRGEKTIVNYEKFLNYRARENRAFAVSVNEENGASVSASGMLDGEDAAGRALRQCEEISKSKCRLYASGGDVVW